jgi:hypothetical protein
MFNQISLFASENTLEFATQNFEEFSRGMNGQSLMLLAGAGLVVWYLFGNKLGIIKDMVLGVIGKIKPVGSSAPTVEQKPLSGDIFDILSATKKSTQNFEVESSDVFFKLIVSWKQTRDLAVKAGCDQAIEIADQMFPYLSVTSCGKKDLDKK